jgi:hypothetical protein
MQTPFCEATVAKSTVMLRRFLLWPVGPLKKGTIIPKYTGEKEA